jgi:hypothetical protein
MSVVLIAFHSGDDLDCVTYEEAETLMESGWLSRAGEPLQVYAIPVRECPRTSRATFASEAIRRTTSHTSWLAFS